MRSTTLSTLAVVSVLVAPSVAAEQLTGCLGSTRGILYKVQEGTDQLRRGDYIECTSDELDAVLEEIESEALSDLEPHRPHAQ